MSRRQSVNREIERANGLLLEAFDALERQVHGQGRVRTRIRAPMHISPESLLAAFMKLQVDAASKDKRAFEQMQDTMKKLRRAANTADEYAKAQQMRKRAAAEQETWKKIHECIGIIIAITLAILLLLAWLLGEKPPDE